MNKILIFASIILYCMRYLQAMEDKTKPSMLSENVSSLFESTTKRIQTIEDERHIARKNFISLPAHCDVHDELLTRLTRHITIEQANNLIAGQVDPATIQSLLAAAEQTEQLKAASDNVSKSMQDRYMDRYIERNKEYYPR